MSLLRKKKFRIGVFAVSGALILYNVYFFTLGKKKPEKAPGTAKKKSAPADESAGGEKPEGTWGEVHGKAAPASSGAPAAAGDPAARTFGRDPFVLPEEESAGKTFEAIFRERLEAGRGAENTPLHEVLAQLGVLKLTGILHDARRPVAVIDHRLVRPGDSLLNGFFDVVAIDPDAVRVRHGGKEFRVPLPEKKVVETNHAREAKESPPAAAPEEKE